MKRRKMNLYLLYHFKDSQNLSLTNEPCAYHIILLFSEVGDLSLADCKKVIPELLDVNDLNFRTKEELIEFSKNCISELDFQSVFLLASNDYNIGIESCHDLSSFREIFDRYGHHIGIEDTDQSSKNIFGKLF